VLLTDVTTSSRSSSGSTSVSPVTTTVTSLPIVPLEMVLEPDATRASDPTVPLADRSCQPNETALFGGPPSVAATATWSLPASGSVAVVSPRLSPEAVGLIVTSPEASARLAPEADVSSTWKDSAGSVVLSALTWTARAPPAAPAGIASVPEALTKSAVVAEPATVRQPTLVVPADGPFTVTGSSTVTVPVRLDGSATDASPIETCGPSTAVTAAAGSPASRSAAPMAPAKERRVFMVPLVRVGPSPDDCASLRSATYDGEEGSAGRQRESPSGASGRSWN
jgi:hypothetical protein